MGNLNSIHYMYNKKYKYKNCLICNKKPEKHNLLQCQLCFIKLHDYCYDKHSNNLGYTRCPNPGCQEVGALGQELYYKNKYIEKQKKQKNKTKE